MKKTIQDAYRDYKKRYLDNVDIVTQTQGLEAGHKLLERMDSAAEFAANIKGYQDDYKRLHPKSHGESLDRLSKWVAQRQTTLRSTKQADKIIKRAKQAGYKGKLTRNDIYFGTARANEFWEWFDAMSGDNDFWGS